MNTLKNLRRRYGRTSLTIVGVALAIAFSTIMLSVGEAINESSKRILDETGVDLIAEPVEFMPLIQELIPIFKMKDGRNIAEAMVDNNSNIQVASPWLNKNLYVTKATPTINASEPPKFVLMTAKGTIPENNIYFRGVDIIKGQRLPTITDPFYANGNYSGGTSSENFTHEILISKHLSKLLEVSVGDMIYCNPIGLFDDFTNKSISEWFENATWFNISGIMVEQFEGQNSLAARLHLSELQFITGEHKDDVVNKIYIKLYDKSKLEEVKVWLETEFIYKDKISVFTTEDILKDINQFLELFEAFSAMVLIITILIAALFISTVLMISTRERTKEIGALRAIGISRASINKMIFKESLVICIIGLIMGFIMGIIGSVWLNYFILSQYETLPAGIQITVITPLTLLEITVITLIIASLASLGPCYWATKVNIADTIRME